MNSPVLPRCRLALVRFAVLLVLGFVSARGEEKQPGAPASSARTDAPMLVIVNGTLSGFQNGPNVPATLQNVVDAISPRYPDATVIITGADGVTIENFTLRWAARGRRNPPLTAVLAALETASGGKFRTTQQGPQDFVLLPGGNLSTANKRAIEVFNLSPYLRGLGLAQEDELRRMTERMTDADLRLANLDRERAVMEKLGNDVRRDVEQRDGALKRDIAMELSGLVSRVSDLKRRLAEQPAEVDRRVSQIRQLVYETVETLKIGTSANPVHLEFQFHPGTNLLVVIGHEEALEVTRKVVTALGGTAGR